MKGFILKTGSEIISAGLDNGLTDMLISNKEFYYLLKLGGLDAANISHIWYNTELQLGDSFSITYDKIERISTPIRIGNDLNTPEDDRVLLKSYYKLKQELIEEGLIDSCDNAQMKRY
jgi:hypothetical protein